MRAMSKEDKRSIILRARVNEREHAMIRGRAERAKLTVSEYLREVALFYEFGSPFSVGTQPPDTYLAWHEWAAVQDAAGLKQSRCPRCGKYRYPQQPCFSLSQCPE